ncbi:MAG: RidA family protein [Candidatus Aenigmarchaeota archaeon]|nr:RidA family protein [Candidatus Aenigmarchaeota archaeon]
MDRTIIRPDGLPEPLGPCVPAVLDGCRYQPEISGMSGRDPATGRLREGVETQTRQALENMAAVLADVGWIRQEVVRARVCLTDMGDYGP